MGTGNQEVNVEERGTGENASDSMGRTGAWASHKVSALIESSYATPKSASSEGGEPAAGGRETRADALSRAEQLERVHGRRGRWC